MKNIALIIILTLFSIELLAEERVETIQLNHRLSSEILPEIQAFLPKKATARAFNDFIILKANNKTITEMKQLINQLDTPLQRVKISVIRTDRQLINQDGHQVSGGVSVGDDVSANVSISKWSTRDARNKDQYFQAQGIANSVISIIMGQGIPQKEQYLILRNNGDLAIQDTTHYININNGFKATSRVLPNNQVVIDILPLFGHFSQRTGTVERSHIVSSVTGNEGEWILLGETSDGNTIEQNGVTRYHSHQQAHQKIYIKVEQLL